MQRGDPLLSTASHQGIPFIPKQAELVALRRTQIAIGIFKKSYVEV